MGTRYRITEAKAKEIFQADDLSKYTHMQCRAADNLMKRRALKALKSKLNNVPDKKVRDYVYLMVDHHFGFAETDDLLTYLNCYPSWVGRR